MPRPSEFGCGLIGALEEALAWKRGDLAMSVRLQDGAARKMTRLELDQERERRNADPAP